MNYFEKRLYFAKNNNINKLFLDKISYYAYQVKTKEKAGI